MNALELLRSMHSETKFRLKATLASDDAAEAEQSWQALQPMLELHEQLEDEYVYTPLADEFGAGTPLGDWAQRHDSDVAVYQALGSIVWVVGVHLGQAANDEEAHNEQALC